MAQNAADNFIHSRMFSWCVCRAITTDNHHQQQTDIRYTSGMDNRHLLERDTRHHYGRDSRHLGSGDIGHHWKQDNCWAKFQDHCPAKNGDICPAKIHNQCCAGGMSQAKFHHIACVSPFGRKLTPTGEGSGGFQRKSMRLITRAKITPHASQYNCTLNADLLRGL